MVSFKQNLDNLEDIKNRIKNKLIEYGVDEPTDVLSNYADKIKEVKNELMREVTSTAKMPTSARWWSSAYGQGMFVAISGRNYASDISAYSTDGINWTQTTMPTSDSWYSVTYGNGMFVAVTYDSNISAYSTDGINWTQTTLPTSTSWSSVTYGNGKFVAVASSSNKSAYSTDGINWTQITLPTSFNCVTYGNGMFVAVRSSNISAYSTDGINWTQTTMPTSDSWYSVTYGNGMFVAITTNVTDISAYSTDGINWTQTTMPTSDKRTSVTYGNGKFVAVGAGDVSACSTDGINWIQGTMPRSYDDDWAFVVYGNGMFVAVVGYTNISAYSLDGITWKNTITEKLPLYELNGTSYIHYNLTDTVIPSCFVKSVTGYQRNWVDRVEFDYTGTDITKDNFEFYCYDGTLYIIATMPSSTYLREPTLKYSPNVTYVNGTQYQDTYGKIGVYKFTVTPNIPVNVYITMTVSSTSRYWNLTIDY